MPLLDLSDAEYLSLRARRLGARQIEIAAALGVSNSAVSQALSDVTDSLHSRIDAHLAELEAEQGRAAQSLAALREAEYTAAVGAARELSLCADDFTDGLSGTALRRLCAEYDAAETGGYGPPSAEYLAVLLLTARVEAGRATL